MNKKTLFLLLLLLGYSIALKSQNYQRKVDSLENRVQLYLEQDSLGKALVDLQEITNLHEYEGAWDAYHEAVDRMFAYAEKLGDKERIIECYNKLGISSCINGRNKEAVEYFQKTINIAIEIEDSVALANSFENIGLVYDYMGKLQTALEYQMKSLRIREEIKHPRFINNYIKISQLLEDIGQPDKQYEYLQKAIEANAKLSPDHERSAIICCEMGEYLADCEMYDSALVYFNKGLEHSEAMEWKRGIAVFLGNMAELYYERGDIAKSVEMHKETLILSEETDDGIGISQELNSLTKLYIELGNLPKARLMSKRALEKTKACDLNYEYSMAIFYASKLAEKEKRFDESLALYKEYHDLTDTLLSKDMKNVMTELETKYQTEKKEQQIELLSAENKLQHQKSQTFLLILIALVLAIVVLVLLYIRRKNIARSKEENLRQKLLLSQMNPHFIFNALGSIQNYMYHNDAKKAAGFLGNFASLTRSILENSAEESVSLSDEIETLKNYMELEKMRLKDRFSYEIHLDDDLDSEFIDIPPMLIQPFVENAIVHGLKEKNDEGKLILSFSDKKKYMEICIEDNGKGINYMKSRGRNGHRSMSMQIFEDRSRLISQKLKRNVEFEIKDLNDIDENREGTIVKIAIPILETA